MVKGKGIKSKLFDVINNSLLIAIAVICMYPFLYIVFASFSSPNSFIKHDFLILLRPVGFSLEAYRNVFTEMLLIGYRNTLFYVVVGTSISMCLTILGAYVLSRKNYLFKRPLTLIIIFTMYFNGGLIPSYLWIQKLGMIDTVWAIILPSALSTYNMIVLRTAFAGIPDSLLEAAKIDGAGELTCLIKIILPLNKASISVILLFYAVSRWNEWLPATIYLRTRSLYPLQIFLRETLLTGTAQDLVNSGGNTVNLTALTEIIKYATIVVASLPILCIYPFIQKYFVTGIMVGGVKE